MMQTMKTTVIGLLVMTAFLAIPVLLIFLIKSAGLAEAVLLVFKIIYFSAAVVIYLAVAYGIGHIILNGR